ncbi:ankyrin [Fusarium coicis]|nr:ankyrin [Fusarium coicis]
MTGDTQEHLPNRGKRRRRNTVSSQAVTHTLNIEATTTHQAADGGHERINELLAFEEAAQDLWTASYYGFKEVVDAAIGKGVDINNPIYGIHPIVWAVKGGHADIVDHLLQQGATVSLFEVYPCQGDEFSTDCSNNSLSAAWHHKKYDIFLLLLDAILTQKCREERWEYSELLRHLDEGDPRERLAERLAIWLKSTYWVPVDPDDSYTGPNMVIWKTLMLVFGMGTYLRGDSIIVRHLIEKKAPIPEPVLAFLRRHWHGIKADHSTGSMSRRLRSRPAILEIIFTAMPLIGQEGDEDLRISIGLTVLLAERFLL